jgi:hypothetical protein
MAIGILESGLRFSDAAQSIERLNVLALFES